MKLTSISFAHPQVPAVRRASLTISGDELHRAHRRLAETGLSAFVLSTCLRVEVAVAGDVDAASSVLAVLFGEATSPHEGKVRQDESVFDHLCRVAAGLESPVVGEREIFAQFRQAVEAFDLEHAPTQALEPVLARVLGVARTVRRRLAEPPEGSLGAIAAERVTAFREVAVLGAGAMARAATTALSELDVSVFSRRPVVVDRRPSRTWSEVAEAFGYPAVVVAVPVAADLLPWTQIEGVLDRRDEPVQVVDLGMPPLPEAIAGHPAVRYVGIDDLASSAAAPVPRTVDSMLAAEAGKAWRRLAIDDRVGSVIAGLMEQADSAVSDEVRRFSRRIATADDPEPILRQLAHTVARRILHGPVSYMASSDRPDATEVLAEAFGVEL